jgi:deoxyadenosine/deoxycytidine kinase
MIITIEGGIGAGKSTMLEICKNIQFKKPHLVIHEDVADWTSMKEPGSNKSIFDLFYEDKSRYAYVFQTYVLFSRISNLLNVLMEHPDKVIICERSFMTDLEVFAKTLYEKGDMTQMEWMVYVKWHEMARHLFNRPIQGQIYLRATPETCYERIHKRQRQSENLIDMEYLENLHQKHEDWLMNKEKNKVPTLVIDGNKDISEIEKNEVDNIREFIHSLM